MFHAVVPEVLQSVQPRWIVVQCGCDGLHKDPLGGISEWKLSSDCLVQCVHHLLSWSPSQSAEPIVHHQPGVLLLGGGGYDPVQTACCWTRLTALCARVELPHEIPESNPYYSRCSCCADLLLGMLNPRGVDGCFFVFTDFALSSCSIALTLAPQFRKTRQLPDRPMNLLL